LIFDSYFKGCVELWDRDMKLIMISAIYTPSSFMHLCDPNGPKGDDRGLGQQKEKAWTDPRGS
jgi:hypothetical protein